MDISKFPPSISVLPPPKGQHSNFDNPKSLATSLIATNVVFIVLALLFVSIRFYVRARVIKSLWWDDWTILFAALSSICHTVIMLSNIRLGYGRHMWDIRLNTLTESTISRLTAIAVIYPISICFVKLSISFLYLRLFDRVMNRPLRAAIYFIMAFCVAFYLANLAVEVAAEVQCSDALASIQNHFCKESSKLIPVITGVLNTATDLYMLILPIPVIARLRMSFRRRCSVLAVLGAGGIACIVSIIRLAWVASHYHISDVLYSAALTSELTAVEINIGIVAASMIVMPKFIESPIFKPLTYSSLWSRLTATSKTHGDGSDSLDGQSASSVSMRHRSSDKEFHARQVDLYHSEDVPSAEGGTIEKGFSGADPIEMSRIPGKSSPGERSS